MGKQTWRCFCLILDDAAAASLIALYFPLKLIPSRVPERYSQESTSIIMAFSRRSAGEFLSEIEMNKNCLFAAWKRVSHEMFKEVYKEKYFIDERQ